MAKVDGFRSRFKRRIGLDPRPISRLDRDRTIHVDRPTREVIGGQIRIGKVDRDRSLAFDHVTGHNRGRRHPVGPGDRARTGRSRVGDFGRQQGIVISDH